VSHEALPHPLLSLLASTGSLFADIARENIMNSLFTAPVTMADIEQKTQGYAAARNELAEAVTALQEDLDKVKARYMGMIRKYVEVLRVHEKDLQDAILKTPGLFEKPKSRTFAGIKVGYAKQPGRLECPDDDQLISAIRRLFPDSVKTLIKVTEKPVKTALSNMPAKDLKRLGVSVVDATDIVIVKPQDSDVDKLVAALMSEEE
tara:strand:+ start:5569 stop:6183 length:615 start_codon:yes stop_codon:yes gene_type:complete